MATQAEEFKALMEGMRAEYRADLLDKLRTIALLWEGLARSNPEPPATRLGELRRLAHTLAGSAQTFGLPEVTSAARELELAFVAALEDPVALAPGGDAALRERIEAALAWLRRAGEPA
jgi:HPt (histidine-containing phosphotransfer) domain-containing protein